MFAWPSYMVQDMWARLLEDREYLSQFQADNCKRLADNYSTLTAILGNHGIEYYKGG